MAYPWVLEGKVSDELYAGRVCLDLFGFYYTTFFYLARTQQGCGFGSHTCML